MSPPDLDPARALVQGDRRVNTLVKLLSNWTGDLFSRRSCGGRGGASCELQAVREISPDARFGLWAG